VDCQLRSKVAKDGGGPSSRDVVLDDQDVMAARNRRERLPSLLV
jgi:hypothetical protein